MAGRHPGCTQRCAKVFPEPVHEQKTLCQGHSEVHQAAAAVHPPRYRVHRGLRPKQRYPAYRNRETIAWCKERSIQLTGPALGRPQKNLEVTKTERRQAYQDICDRNMIEGEFGTGKRAYGLNRIMAHLRETSFCVIGVALLCMNLTKRLRSLCLDLFTGLLQILCSIDRLSAIA